MIRWRLCWPQGALGPPSGETSDLDLLAVRDTASAAWLRSVPGTLPAPEGINVAVSVFTTGDIDALRVPPRVIQSLGRAAGGTGVLYQRPGYLLPVPAHADADRTSRGELGLVLMTTRRLLAELTRMSAPCTSTWTCWPR